MRIVAAAAALLVASLTSASAQPGLTPAQSQDSEEPTSRASTPPSSVLAPAPMPAGYYYGPVSALPAPTIEGQTKSESTATMLSLGVTAGGFALLAAAGRQQEGGGTMATLGVLSLLVGPSAGHIYAGETGRAVGMSVLRGGAALVFLLGVVRAATAWDVDCFECSHHDNDGDEGEMMMWVGGATLVAATVYDIIDAPRAARRKNAKLRSYSMQPIMVNAANGPAPGFGIGGRF